jgi:hypothetical protein
MVPDYQMVTKGKTYHATDATAHAIGKVQEISHSQRSGMSGIINKDTFFQ